MGSEDAKILNGDFSSVPDAKSNELDIHVKDVHDVDISSVVTQVSEMF